LGAKTTEKMKLIIGIQGLGPKKKREIVQGRIRGAKGEKR